MSSRRPSSPFGVFVVVVVLVVAGLTSVAIVNQGPTDGFDGASVDGQSPAHYQPDYVEGETDPETGTLTVDTETEGKRILVETQHETQFDERDLAPLAETMLAAGHQFTVQEDDAIEYDDLLERYDGLLLIQPTESFTAEQIRALREFTEDGGHLVILAEPTTMGVSDGLATTAGKRFDATNLTAQFGTIVGSEPLYNLDDARTDNNFKSIYASPTREGTLTAGVDTISLDSGGYLRVRDGSVAAPVFTAAEGTKTLTTRRTDTYPTVTQTENVVVVADTSFIQRSELYDVDNERFVGNLLEFLASGDSE